MPSPSLRFKKRKKSTKKPKPKVQQLNAFMLIDASASMLGHRAGAIKLLEQQIETFREGHSTVPTRVTIASFNERYHPLCHHTEAADELLEEIDTDSYKPDGMTDINSPVKNILEPNLKPKSPHQLVIITDGEHNTGQVTTPEVKALIQKALATDYWTIAFACPPGKRDAILAKYGIPEGSVTEWELSTKGVQTLSVQVSSGTQALYRNITRGKGNVRGSFFRPDLDVTKSQVKRTLDDVTKQFILEIVDPLDPLTISDFVKAKGHKFEVGCAYYQLTKKEKVQDFKDLVLREISTSKLYSGDDARDLLGIPSGGTIDLNPTFSNKYQVFIRSTSWNRKLVTGTNVLIKKVP